MDDILFFQYCVPTFLFEETRAINAILDYPEYLSSRRTFVVTRHLRGNHNNWCQSANGNGYLHFAEGSRHKLTYVALDYKGNRNSRTFWIRAVAAPPQQGAAKHLSGIDCQGIQVAYFKRNDIGKPGFRLVMEEGTLYDNDQLLYSVAPHAGLLGNIHTVRLQKNDLPPHKSMFVHMPLPYLKDTVLRSKLVMVSVSGKHMSALATRRQDNVLVGTTRNFGNFGIALDTTAPRLVPVNLHDGGRFVKGTTWRVKIWDDLSGIDAYHCYVNGQWVLSRYDGKTSSLYIDPSEALKSGRNSIRIVLSDAVGNRTEKIFMVTY